MPDLNQYINWKIARGKEGGLSFQRIHILPGLYYHRITQSNHGTITHYYEAVDNNKFTVDTNSQYYRISDNYIPSTVSNVDNKSILSGKFSTISGNTIGIGVGSFKIVEAKSDKGRPYDFT